MGWWKLTLEISVEVSNENIFSHFETDLRQKASQK